MFKIRDKVWIWGHPPHSLVAEFNLDGNMTPTAGMEYFGAKNVFYVPMHNVVDRKACSEEMAPCLQAGWSMENPEQVEELLELKKDYKNITRGVFDDFFNKGTKGSYEHYTVDSFKALKERLHSSGLDMWLVYYTMNTDEEVLNQFMPILDGVILWFWHAVDNAEFEQKLQEYLQRTKGQKHMVGIYLYDFGNKKEANPDTVIYQLNRAKQLLIDGVIEGFVLHTNGVVDLGYEAVKVAKEWMEKNGDEIIG